MLDRANIDALLLLLERADLIVVTIGKKQAALDPKMFFELRKFIAWPE